MSMEYLLLHVEALFETWSENTKSIEGLSQSRQTVSAGIEGHGRETTSVMHDVFPNRHHVRRKDPARDSMYL